VRRRLYAGDVSPFFLSDGFTYRSMVWGPLRRVTARPSSSSFLFPSPLQGLRRRCPLFFFFSFSPGRHGRERLFFFSSLSERSGAPFSFLREETWTIFSFSHREEDFFPPLMKNCYRAPPPPHQGKGWLPLSISRWIKPPFFSGEGRVRALFFFF